MVGSAQCRSSNCQHHRLSPCARHHQVGQRRQLPAPQFLRRQSQARVPAAAECRAAEPAGSILHRIELDQRQCILQVREALLGGHVGTAETLAAPIGDRVQRRVLQKLRTTPFGPGVRRVAQSGMKFLDQAGFTQSRLADDQHQLALALPRPLPAPHQHGDFLVATDERREMALPGTASAAARPHEPEQRHRLGHAFEFVAAALLGDKQAGDLALHPRRHNDRAWLCQRLHSRRNVGRIAVNLARRIDHYRAGFDPDARVERRLASTGILAVHLGERALDRERGPRRAFGVVLLRHRIAEQRHQPVAQLFGDVAAHLRHRRRGGIEIGADQIAPLLGIKLRGNAGRTHQIAEHHREVAALSRTKLRRLRGGNIRSWRGYCVNGSCRQSVTAFQAELGTRRVRVAARRTASEKSRTALQAEFAASGNISLAARTLHGSSL